MGESATRPTANSTQRGPVTRLFVSRDAGKPQDADPQPQLVTSNPQLITGSDLIAWNRVFFYLHRWFTDPETTKVDSLLLN
jgi:hypothetical protein